MILPPLVFPGNIDAHFLEVFFKMGFSIFIKNLSVAYEGDCGEQSVVITVNYILKRKANLY